MYSKPEPTEKNGCEKMHLLFYATLKNGTGKLLSDLNQDLVSEYKGDFCRNIDTLSQKLRKSLDDLTIAVLLAESQQDLLDILSIKDLLKGVRIVLILPDNNEDSIRKGHTLFPRYLTDVNSDFAWVTLVLKKMLSSSDAVKKQNNNKWPITNKPINQ